MCSNVSFGTQSSGVDTHRPEEVGLKLAK